MAGIRGGGGVQTNVSLAKKSEVNDSVNSVTSIRLHKRWGVNTLQYSHPLTRPVTHLALSCNALYTWLTYISNYHNNRTLIIGEKKHKNPIREQIYIYFFFAQNVSVFSWYLGHRILFISVHLFCILPFFQHLCSLNSFFCLTIKVNTLKLNKCRVNWV